MLRRLIFVCLLALLAISSISPAVAAPAGTWAAIGTYRTELGEESGEIAAYADGLLYVTNSADNSLDVVDARRPEAPRRFKRVDLSPYGAGPNSVAVNKWLVAVAVEADPITDPGAVVFLDRLGNVLVSVPVGALPDMLVFSEDGRYLLVANEGEPNSYGAADSVDPEGSISIIKIPRWYKPDDARKALPSDLVRTVDFRAFNAGGVRNGELDPKIRIFGPGASVAQDLEPEYIALSGDGRQAFVTLQENNALAVVNVEKARIEKLVALGTKDHAAAGAGLDASDEDGTINIRPWPVLGMYQPDAVGAYAVGGKTFLVTANEGDAREYDGFEEEVRVGDEEFPLAAAAFPDAAELKAESALGRLAVTVTSPQNSAGEYTAIQAFGGRSFSIWNARGKLVFDSGEQFEQLTAEALPDYFNANNDDNDASSFDTRSDAKGPEPEGLAVGKIGRRSYAFICLERIGGLMIYDISDPRAPSFVQYLNNRNFDEPVENADGSINPLAGDLGPEGVSFVANGPRGKPLVVVSNEISGSVTFYGLVR